MSSDNGRERQRDGVDILRGLGQGRRGCKSRLNGGIISQQIVVEADDSNKNLFIFAIAISNQCIAW